MSKINYYLAGANTCQGFVSCFDEINIKNGKEFKYVLKGGPGTGKSTMLKKIANYFYNKGFSIEVYYCSSDIKSLDAIRIVEKNVCVVDGTSPHEQDASLPNLNAKIINLGDCVEENIAKSKSKIQSLLLKKQQCFKDAYKLLSGIKDLSEFERNHKCVNVNSEISALLMNAKIQKNIQKGSVRTVFFEYFNEKGNQSIEKTNKFKKIYIKNNEGLVKKLEENLISFNFNIIKVKNIYSLNCDGIIIPDLNLYFCVKHKMNKEYKKIINDIACLVGKKVSSAKFYHKQIEKYFIENINFKQLDKLTLQTIAEIDNK